MKEIYLIRHTTPNIQPGICYGAADLDVNGDFRNEADLIKEIISDVRPDYLFSSPLKRCGKLADYLFPYEHKHYDDRIKEMSFGEWELKPWDGIDKKEMKLWSSDFVSLSPPKGESFQDLYNRKQSFFAESIHPLPEKSVAAIVTHSGILRCVLSRYLYIPLEKTFRLKINYGAVIKLILHSEYAEIEFLKP